MLGRSCAFRGLSLHRTSEISLLNRLHNVSVGRRRFSLSASLLKTPPTSKRPPSNPRTTTTPVPEPGSTLKFAGRLPEAVSRLERKVAKQGSLVLFKAPSLRGYILGAYSVAAFCFAYSVYNSYITFQAPLVPLPIWQKTLFGGICILMSALGTVFIFRTGRLIKSITATNSNGQTYLHFTVRRTVPFVKPMQFDVLPRQIAFSNRLVAAPDRIPQPGAVSEKTATPKVRPADISFFKAPGTKISFHLWRLVRSVRQLFTAEDFVFLDVEGHKGAFRLDVKGFVADDLLLLADPRSARYSPTR